MKLNIRNMLLPALLAASVVVNLFSVTALVYLKVPGVHRAFLPYYKTIKNAVFGSHSYSNSTSTRKRSPQMPYKPELRLSIINQLSLSDDFDIQDWKNQVLSTLRNLIGLSDIIAPFSITKSEAEVNNKYVLQRMTMPSPLGYDNIVLYKLMPSRLPSDHAKPAVVLVIPGSGMKSVNGLLGRTVDYHRSAGIKLVTHGYAVYVVESFAVGERAFDVGSLLDEGVNSPHAVGMYGIYSGEYLAKIFIADLLSVIEFIKTEDDVNGDMLVTFGVSRGGFLSLLVAALSQDVKGAVIASGLVDPDRYIFNNFKQPIIPQEGRYFLRSDIAGTIAPRPILLSYGTNRSLSRGDLAEYPGNIEEAQTSRTVNRVKYIYKLFNAGGSVSVSIHEGGHTWPEKDTFEFLRSVVGY